MAPESFARATAILPASSTAKSIASSLSWKSKASVPLYTTHSGLSEKSPNAARTDTSTTSVTELDIAPIALPTS